MAGNVWEWVTDWYSNTYYLETDSVNPQGPDSGDFKVIRGGSWDDGDDYMRVANRYFFDPDWPYSHLGFRCVHSP